MNQESEVAKRNEYNNSLYKKSRLFPTLFLTMSSSDVLVAILLAYKRIENKVTSVIYLNEYNFKIKICISYNGKIFNAYPNI